MECLALSRGDRRIRMILCYEHYTFGFQRAEEASPPKYICADCGTGFSKRKYGNLHEKTYSSNCQIQSGGQLLNVHRGSISSSATSAEVKLARVLWAKCVIADRTSMRQAECPVCLDETRVVSACANAHDICRNCLRHPSLASCPICRGALTARE